MKFFTFVYFVLLAFLCLFKTYESCSRKKINKNIIIDIDDKCSENNNNFQIKERETALLRFVEVLCLDEFKVNLFVENEIFRNLRKDCLLKYILNLTNVYLWNTPKVKTYDTLKKVKMMTYMDSVRKLTILNVNYCFKPTSQIYSFKKFDFDQYDVDENNKRLILYLRIKELKTDKTTFVLFFEHTWHEK